MLPNFYDKNALSQMATHIFPPHNAQYILVLINDIFEATENQPCW